MAIMSTDSVSTGHAPNRGMQSIASNREMQGPMSDRGMQGHMPNRGMQNPASNREMQGPMSDRGMQGHMPNRGMQNPASNREMQGPMSDRGMQGHMPNRGMHGPAPNRGMQSIASNREMQDPMSDRGMQGHMPNRGLHGPVQNRGMQGHAPNRGMQSREMQSPMPERGTHGPMPDRGMQSTASNREMQSPMPDRGMHGPMLDRSMQCSALDRGMQCHVPDRAMPSPGLNNPGMYNQPNIPTSAARPQASMMQVSSPFPIQQSPQFVSSPQGQESVNAMGLQSGQVPQNSMPQGPIVQHVMIPVPVPIGTEISPHLLRPQIITTAGIPSQSHLTGSQGQNQFPQMQIQGQFPNMQGHFPNVQVQGPFQSQNQSLGLQHQGNLGSGQFQGPAFQTASPNAPLKNMGSDKDDLSYYMDNESRNRNRRSVENNQRYEDLEPQPRVTHEEVYVRNDGKSEGYKHEDYERGLQVQHRIEHEREYERKQRERSRSQGSSNISYMSEHTDRSRREQYSNASHFSDREQSGSLRRHEELERHDKQSAHGQIERLSTKTHEHFNRLGEFERNKRSDRNLEYDREHHSDRLEYERMSRLDKFERNQGSSRDTKFESGSISISQSEFKRHEQYERDQRYIMQTDIEMNQAFNEQEKFEDEQIVDREQIYDSYRHFDERPSEDLRHEHKDEYKDERQFGNNFDDLKNIQQSNTDECRNEQRFESERHSGAILYTDGERIDLEGRGIEHYDREDRHFERVDERGGINQEEYDFSKEAGKRKLSPVSSERSSRKARREYSPVSESKSHGDLKIHVSDNGRWIETDSNLSPISAGAFDSDRHHNERHKINESDIRNETNSLDGAEMISDSESCIGNDNLNDVRTLGNDLSPVSPHSSTVESQSHNDEPENNKSQHAVEKVTLSPSHHSRHSDDRSHHSKYRDDGSSRSQQTKHSDDWQKEGRHKSDSRESHDHVPEQKIQSPERKMKEFQLKVPDLCQHHNQKGCRWNGCAKLHLCKYFVTDICKFGNFCTKGHDLFKGQTYNLLNEINPGFKNSNVTEEQIKLILKNRLAGAGVPVNLQKRLYTYKTDHCEKEKILTNEKQNVVAADPTFDARNYAPGSNFDFKAADNETKSQFAKTSSKKKIESSQGTKNTDNKAKTGNTKAKKTDKKSTQSSKISKTNESEQKQSKNRKQKSTKTIKKTEKDKNKTTKLEKSKDENALSPISGEEDDWEKYEKYESISEDGLSEKDKKEDELDNVSSDESIVEQVQVNRSVESFPLPTPENIAVPIGMNDPLVFNRPLKNNPQSYIGPLNRPPPMFPITADRPLFPVVNQNLQPANVGSNMPGLGVGVRPPLPGTVPNHLPSPEFMHHVIQNLPKFKVEPTEQKNAFKNDNNPAVIEKESLKKKAKLDKVEKDPELKETIKKLWKFPHKGIVNMSIIEFVTETVAYKEEFIAEIIRILVTLELPYVTMKKLLSVIKEKVSINVKSETDMRKILEMYPNNFKIIETVDSDDESDDLGSKKNFQIKANVGLGFCEKHGFLPFAIGKCECNALHLCKFYFLSDCPSKLCKFGHRLKTEHNIAVLRQHKLHRLTGEEILNFLADTDNRNKETIPSICKYYIREKGCYKGAITEYDTICHSLHLCSYILKGKCMNRECDRSHSIRDKQPLSLLQKYGLDPNELGDETVLQMLGERALESEKDRGRKIVIKQQSQLGKTRSETSGNSITNKQGKNSSPGEGLTILTHSETRISSKYFVQNFKIPAVCKFYQNEMGCRKKDWGSEGKCFFLHICQHYVNGDCKFGGKCKRSHDLFSGQAAEILEKYNFDLENLTASDILMRLNCASGAPVEIPKTKNTLDKEKVEVTIEYGSQSDELDGSKFEIPKHAVEVETRINIEETDGFTSDTEKKSKGTKGSLKKQKSSKQKPSPFDSCNIEDVIKHIMEHNAVDEEK